MRLRNAISINPVERIAVGNRGTRPVSSQVRTIGAASATETTEKNAAKLEKKASGRSPLMKRMIVQRMRQPSRKVRS